jgi:TonB family protein
MRDTITPEASSSTFTELNVRLEKGKPHFIRLHDSVVRRLERELVVNRASTGLLLGSINVGENCTITVELFEPTTKLDELIRARESGGSLRVVGYYRSHPRDDFALDPTDRLLYLRCFPKEARLVLLVKPPKADAGTAMFFLGENGLLVTDRATVEFPFNLRELGAEEPTALSVAAPVVVPPAKVSKPGRGGLLWKLVVAGVVVIASVFGLGELRVFDQPDVHPSPKQVVMANSTPSAPQPVRAQAGGQEIAKTSKPALSMPPLDPTANATPAGLAAPPNAKPAPPTLGSQRTLVAQNSAPKALVPFRPEPLQTLKPAPVIDATPPPVSTERLPVVPSDLLPRPKPVQANLPYTPPSAIRQSAPLVPEKLLQSIRGDIVVRVRVNVDADGKVVAAEPVGGGSPVAEALADSAISAVKHWQFEPARRGGDKVAGDVVLSFTFRK